MPYYIKEKPILQNSSDVRNLTCLRYRTSNWRRNVNNLPPRTSRLDLFVQGAYGNPGLNMLKNEFSAYYVAGVRLSWNFGNLYTRKNESRQLILNQQDVNVQKETFLFNTHLEITQNNSEIKKLTELMKNDEEIITLRNNIKISPSKSCQRNTDRYRNVT